MMTNQAQNHRGTEAKRRKGGKPDALSFSAFFLCASMPLRLCAFLKRLPALALIFLILLTPFSPVFAEINDQVKIEYAVKAGFIYNFTKFTQWPKNAFQKGQKEFIIGVLGKNPFGNSLKLLASQKKAKKRKIVIRRFSSPDEITECHILFINTSKDGNLKKVLAKFGEKPILIIGDTKGFAEKGVAVNFFIQDEKVRFEFNRKALEKAGIKVSSQLLHLGKIIE